MPTRNFLRSHGRLQVELCLCGGALCLQRIGTGCESIIQAVLRSILHGLGIGQVCLRSLQLSGGTEYAVISLLDLEDDSAMSIVEAEVGGQKLSARRSDPRRTSKIKNGVVELEIKLRG